MEISMKIYSAKIRLSGSIMNEVRRDNLSAPEVILLRHLHGHDAVTDIVEVGGDRRAHSDERERLGDLYDSGGEKGLILTLFGPPHQELPSELPEVSKPVEHKPRRKRTSSMPGIPAPQKEAAAAFLE
jgi:hypothetical protein